MCDYSLMGVENRLANEGEELVTHRFGTGTIGLTSVADVNNLKAWKTAQNEAGMIAGIKRAVCGSAKPVVSAVCVPPGAKLRVDMGNGKLADATFDQLTGQAGVYRDAIRFESGCTPLLQNLPIGMRIIIVSLAGATEREPVYEGALAHVAR